MSSILAPGSHSCAHCSAVATLACNGCRDAPDGAGGVVRTVWYCGATCQKKDWPKHKSKCKDAQCRLRLYRAGKLLQSLYYIFLRQAWNWSIDRIERINESDTWVVYSGESRGKSTLVEFPFEMFADSRDGAVLLAYRNSYGAVAHMRYTVQVVLKGWCACQKMHRKHAPLNPCC